MEISKLFFQNGLNLTNDMQEKFLNYKDLLLSWNEKINLTAITEEEEIVEKHFLDSVLPFKYINVNIGSKIIDIGTGAGFPGIPMKIYRQDLKLTLLDSLNKRVNFLNEVSLKLSLDAECIHMRAEDGSKKPPLRESFDVATARAVAALPVLTEYCIPYIKVGGIFVALKGPNEDVESSKSAVSTLGCEISEVIDYSLPCGDQRKLIIIRKLSHTLPKYPRNSSRISSEPL